MNEKNLHSQPFTMVLVITIVLLVASQFNTEISIFGFQTKKADLLSDLIQNEELIKDTLIELIAKDSTTSKDSVKIEEIASLKKNESNIIDFKTDSSSALSHFFQSLNETKKQKAKTRIAYFGDSMIEGDLITQDFRSSMQDSFGGDGVGFVPITSIVAGFRSSVRHSFKGWTTYNLLENPPANHVLGISGYGFVPNTISPEDTSNTIEESWVKYAAVNKKHIDRFYETKLLYGKSSGENFVTINGSRYSLKGENTVNQIAIDDQNSQYIKATFQCKTPLDVFGFSMESDSGVFVDNFSFRGNSGMPITKVHQSVYAGTDNYLGYDLIILEYGLNAVNSKVTDFSWYERGMNNVIKHIQASFPNSSILLISVGDKGYRKNGVYETDPSVPILVEAQKRMAKNNKIAFWSLYDAMGGNGSMVKWVEGDTVLANKDYTHFNFKGSHKAGTLLFSKLMNEYKQFNNKNALSALSFSGQVKQ